MQNIMGNKFTLQNVQRKFVYKDHPRDHQNVALYTRGLYMHVQ